jgi:hypothetical protein
LRALAGGDEQRARAAVQRRAAQPPLEDRIARGREQPARAALAHLEHHVRLHRPQREPPPLVLEEQPVAVRRLGGRGPRQLERRRERRAERLQPHRALAVGGGAVGRALRAAAVDDRVQLAAQRQQARVLVAQAHRRREAGARAGLLLRRAGRLAEGRDGRGAQVDGAAAREHPARRALGRGVGRVRDLGQHDKRAPYVGARRLHTRRVHHTHRREHLHEQPAPLWQCTLGLLGQMRHTRNSNRKRGIPATLSF